MSSGTLSTSLMVVDGSGDASDEIKNVDGLLMGVRVNNQTSNSNTFDITIAEKGGLERTLLEITGISGTDNWYNPANEMQTTAGVGVGAYTPFQIQNNKLTVTIANGTASDNIKVSVEIL
jgi:hypothetical protein